MATQSKARPVSYPPAAPLSHLRTPNPLDPEAPSPIGPTGESVPIEQSALDQQVTAVDRTDSTRSYHTGNSNKTLTRSAKKPVWRQWLLEIASFIIAVLRVYDGRSLPKLPMSITLNTFLAFFTTLSKVAFMSPISEALSQWKWNILVSGRPRAQQGRQVHEFDVLDNASRATWGSWPVIWNFRWRHVVSLAAILSILSIFVTPVTQALVSYHQRPAVSSEVASVPLARNHISYGDRRRRSEDLSDLILAITAGMNNRVTGGGPVEHLDAICASTNCTFEPYSSLGVGMKMKDISRLVTVETLNETGFETDPFLAQVHQIRRDSPVDLTSNRARVASLPNGVSFISPFSYGYFLIANDASLAFNDNEVDNATSFLNFFLIYTKAGNVSYPGFDDNTTEPWEFGAIEIMYYAAVNTFWTSSFKGNSTTEIIAESNVPLDIAENLPVRNANCSERSPGTYTCEPLVLYEDMDEGAAYLQDPAAPDDPNSRYVLGRWFAFQLTQMVSQLMKSKFYWNGLEKASFIVTTSNFLAIIQALGWRHRDADHIIPTKGYDTEIQMEELESFFRGLAISLSNMLRSSKHHTETHYGQTWVSETFVHITWGWIVFLAVEMILSFLFLAATIYRTAKLKAPVLKSSELATLLVSSDEVRQKVGTIERLEDAEANARKVAVKLEGNKMVLA
ncbi:hypothetical protein OQA88_5456 [Cercophora sp. LCS_1]